MLGRLNEARTQEGLPLLTRTPCLEDLHGAVEPRQVGGVKLESLAVTFESLRRPREPFKGTAGEEHEVHGPAPAFPRCLDRLERFR